MPTTPLPGPPNLEHRHLRSALEFAVAIAAAGLRSRPPLEVPDELRQFLRQSRLASGALGRIRRIVEANPAYRERIAEAATAELVDPIGVEWLRREDRWEDRVAELVASSAESAVAADSERSLKRAERRRAAAEEVAARAQSEVATLTDRLAELRRERDQLRRESASASAELTALRSGAERLRQEARHARDRADGDRQRLAAVQAELAAARARADTAERQRDELLAARAAFPGAGAEDVRELRDLTKAARELADRLAALVEVGRPARQQVTVPQALAKDPLRSAEHLLAVPGVVVLVDGYNIAKLTWPELSLEQQRERTLDAVDDVARRFAAEIAVVFDGAAVVGAHTSRRRLARVRYSPPGISADDVIRGEVAALDPGRPVVVVTNDAAIRRDVTAAGANVVASGTFADLALR